MYLVTGGAGYIGSHFIHYLVKQKNISPQDIVVFDNLKYGHRENLPEGVICIQGDLLNKESIASVFEKYSITAVVHFAAYAYVRESMKDPGLYYENNLVGGLHLIECMQKNNVKTIIFSSSCATYGIQKTKLMQEDHPQEPINPYGHSKLVFEQMLSFYRTVYGMRYVALRYFNAGGAAFGIGEHHEPEPHIIPRIIAVAQGKEPHIAIYGTDYPTPDGSCIRDYIHVADLAHAHYAALQLLEKEDVGEFINLGTGKGASIIELIKLVESVSGEKITVINKPRNPGDPPALVADFVKAKSLLNWSPEHSIKDIIQDAWNWHNKT